jgi:hypothetical protein
MVCDEFSQRGRDMFGILRVWESKHGKCFSRIMGFGAMKYLGLISPWGVLFGPMCRGVKGAWAMGHA